jgi:hypothetical protein
MLKALEHNTVTLVIGSAEAKMSRMTLKSTSDLGICQYQGRLKMFKALDKLLNYRNLTIIIGLLTKDMVQASQGLSHTTVPYNLYFGALFDITTSNQLRQGFAAPYMKSGRQLFPVACATIKYLAASCPKNNTCTNFIQMCRLMLQDLSWHFLYWSAHYKTQTMSVNLWACLDGTETLPRTL